MAHKKDDPKLIAFANWLPGQLTQVDKTLIQTMVSVSGLGRWTVFEAAIKNHAARYAKDHEGILVLKRREHYEAAGETLCAMALRGELEIEGVDFTLSGAPCKGHSTQASQSQRSPLVDLCESTLKALKQ